MKSSRGQVYLLPFAPEYVTFPAWPDRYGLSFLVPGIT